MPIAMDVLSRLLRKQGCAVLGHELRSHHLWMYVYQMYPSGAEPTESIWKEEATLEGDWMIVLPHSSRPN